MKKILGFASVIIMIGAMGYIFMSDHNAGEVEATRQTEVKKAAKSPKKGLASITDTTESSSTTKISKQKTKTKTTAELPDVSPDDWKLVLVGPENKLETEVDESSQLTALSNGYLIDKRIESDYQEFAQAAQDAGYPLVMVSAFRSVTSQEQVFAQHVQEVMAQQGITEEAATKITKETITEPGYSEHHTGLAVDVVDEDWYNNYPSTVLEASYGDQPGAKWIAENCAKYGFIVRYPKNREDITKITYEPWHLRYVGKESAEYITKNQLTLEEYLNELNEK